jgi:hypothetical protein
MDYEPNCAICGKPPGACPCESERLQIALDQAQSRVIEARLAEMRYAEEEQQLVLN